MMIRAFVVAVACVCAAVPARAAVVEAVDLPTLCRDATRIVHGVVVGEASAWRDGIIVTRVTVAVRRALKGPAARTLVVSRLGGVVDGIGQVAPGEAELAPGEEIVLFVEPVLGELRVVGMAQGVFHVADGRAAQRLAGLTLVGAKARERTYTLRALLAAIAREAR